MDLTAVFSLLEENLDRIEFVKEAIGLQDFLFIAQDGTEEFEDSPFYACFDVAIDPDNEELNFISMKKNMISAVDEILLRMTEFFSATDRTLYLWVVFEESSLEQTDMFRVMDKLRSKVETSPFEAKAKLRQYPEWFIGKLPSEIAEENNLLQKIKEYEESLHETMQKELMKKIESAVITGDRAMFETYCTQYNKLYQS